MNKVKVRVVLIVVATVCIAVGLYFGNNKEMFNKAALICLECIGIG